MIESPFTAYDGTLLTIDIGAIVANWAKLRDICRPGSCAAVVKADAYGLGMAEVAPALAAAGCTTFFVATPDEALRLQALLPEATVYALCGPFGDAAAAFAEAGVRPVLNHLGDIAHWAAMAWRLERPLPAAIHLDTGMNRLGLGPDEVAALAGDLERLAGIDLKLWMSHLACSEETASPMNPLQRRAFAGRLADLPRAPLSLANSSGMFLGPEYRLDLARPGVALYGANPTPGRPNPMTGVVRLLGRVLQVRDVDTGMTVGYGATHRFSAKGRIATIAVGYADGYLRSLSGSGAVVFDGVTAPVVGRVSMDLITVDVSAFPEHKIRPGDWAELIGPAMPVDEVARRAGTIGYEILTSLGARYRRDYLRPGSGNSASGKAE